MSDPMQDNKELHNAWHLYFKELEEWRKRQEWHLNKLYELQEGVKEEVQMIDYKISEIPIPVISGEIEHNILHKLLKKELSSLFHKPVIYLVDRKYQLIEKSEMERFLANDKTNLIKYVPEWHDCDDFSFRLMGQVSVPNWSGIAFGIAFSKVHAFNLFVDAQQKVFLIEPQSDKIWAIDKVPKKYKKYFLPVMFILM